LYYRMCNYILLSRGHPRSTLFPYTTLFRSTLHAEGQCERHAPCRRRCACDGVTSSDAKVRGMVEGLPGRGVIFTVGYEGLQLDRSEEHTSELQSRENLVCRLLLEKKK